MDEYMLDSTMLIRPIHIIKPYFTGYTSKFNGHQILALSYLKMYGKYEYV